jgi:NAD(P)-dependent dehydrogenase (short-subunit alcohol dehydrogenase family)
MTTNALAPFLLTTLLSPLLTRTAGTAPKDTVRVVFVTSLLQSGVAAGAMDFDNLGSPRILEKPMQNYMQSKVGGTWLAVEFGRRLGAGSAREKGVLCVVSELRISCGKRYRRSIYSKVLTDLLEYRVFIRD